MKFGMESEKLLWDTRTRSIAHSANRILASLDDYKVVYGDAPVDRVTGEFVLNMIEIASSPSEDLLDVVRDYLFSYELIRDVAARGGVVPLPLAASPVSFDPIMVAKWRYFVQNAALTRDPNVGWLLRPQHKLFDAANCAGVHIHIDVATPAEFVAFDPDFARMHNVAAMLAPLVALGSSPYFRGVHEASSMRALRYYFGVYAECPELGGMPPVSDDPVDLVRYYYDGLRSFRRRGRDVGIDANDMDRLTERAGTHWGMVRWNRRWNTIELRCLDTDFVDLNLAKLATVAGVVRRAASDWTVRVGPAGRGAPAARDVWDASADPLLEDLLTSFVDRPHKTLNVLPQPMLHRLIWLAITDGLTHPLVYAYLLRIVKFAHVGLRPHELRLLQPLLEVLKSRRSTAEAVLERTGHAARIDEATSTGIVEHAIEEEQRRYSKIRGVLPAELQPPTEHPFPQGELEVFVRDWADWSSESV